MPPKTKFNRSDLISAGLEIVRKHGLRELTARRIAKRLESSTSPVYSQFESIKELELEVIKRIRDQLIEYAFRPYTEQVFLNMGLGVARFAREHPLLYRAFFLERDDFKSLTEDFASQMIEKMGEDECLVSLSIKQRAHLLNTMWTFTHGLATLICIGLAPDDSDEYIQHTLMAVGGPVIEAAIKQSIESNNNK